MFRTKFLAVLVIAFVSSPMVFAGGGGGKSFDKGCTVKRGSLDTQPFHQENSHTCKALDKDIDGSDGPRDGFVRGKD
jgi:hypothetical protein